MRNLGYKYDNILSNEIRHVAYKQYLINPLEEFSSIYFSVDSLNSSSRLEACKTI